MTIPDSANGGVSRVSARAAQNEVSLDISRTPTYKTRRFLKCGINDRVGVLVEKELIQI